MILPQTPGAIVGHVTPEREMGPARRPLSEHRHGERTFPTKPATTLGPGRLRAHLLRLFVIVLC